MMRAGKYCINTSSCIRIIQLRRYGSTLDCQRWSILDLQSPHGHITFFKGVWHENQKDGPHELWFSQLNDMPPLAQRFKMVSPELERRRRCKEWDSQASIIYSCCHPQQCLLKQNIHKGPSSRTRLDHSWYALPKTQILVIVICRELHLTWNYKSRYHMVDILWRFGWSRMKPKLRNRHKQNDKRDYGIKCTNMIYGFLGLKFRPSINSFW